MQRKRKSENAAIIEMMREFRDLVNEPRRQYSLMGSQSNWNKLCSAMDVIEDTSMAIRSYSSQGATSNKAKLYLETYGVLQALKVRQDAIFDLCNTLASSRHKGDFQALETVKSARVSVAGHPTKKQRDGDGPHHLVQMSLGRGGFEVMSHSAGGPKFSHVNIADLIQRQEHDLGEILKGIIDDLKDADAKHKAKFLGDKLEAAFPSTLGYSFEKIYEHIRGGHLAVLGVWGIEEVDRTLAEYRRGLEARGIQIDTYDSIQYYFELLAYPVDQLRAYLQKKDSEI